MKTRNKYLILSLIAGLLYVGFFIWFIVWTVGGVLSKSVGVTIAFVVISAVLAILFAAALLKLIEQITLIKSLKLENSYNLGITTDFYNLFAFQKRCRLILKKKKDVEKAIYIASFTASEQSLMQNARRNEEINKLNASIAMGLGSLFSDKNAEYPRKDFIFCFNHGSFLICAINKDKADMQRLFDVISDLIFKIVADSEMHIWIHPLFGVSEITDRSELFMHIENATIARDMSEKNFETVTYYDESFRKNVSYDDRKDILEALEKKEFVVYYQAKYNLALKEFTSAEALVRWNSSKYGLLQPSKFVNKAQMAGLIHEINSFVFRKVCEDLNEEKRKGRRMLPVSINFSLYEFYSPSTLEWIKSVLDEYKIDPSYIQIEITEQVSQANQFLSVSIIKKLKEMGIKILMDDFGVGFSNIGNLRKIPFDAVKIDKSLIDDIVENAKSRDVVKLLISLCKLNEMEVIAEGVDSKEQVDILRRSRCDTIQGFYFSKALQKEEYEKLLKENPFEKKGGNN